MDRLEESVYTVLHLKDANRETVRTHGDAFPPSE